MAGDDNENNKKYFYIFMILFVISGSLVTIANKNVLINEAFGIPFVHVWFLAVFTSFGKVLFIPLYYIFLYKNDKRETSRKRLTTVATSPDTNDKNVYFIQTAEDSRENEAEKPEINLIVLILPALSDIISAIFLGLGLRFIPGSVFRMFTITGVIFTKIFSVCFLKNPAYRHQYFGIFIVSIGLFVVGYSTFSNSKISTIEIVWGLILTVLGQLFISIQYSIEESIMRRYRCHPIKAVGYEGAWAMIFIAVILVIFEYINCTPPIGADKNLSFYFCNVDTEGNWTVENTGFALKQMVENSFILVNCILFGLGYCLMIYSGISFSNYSSSAARSVLDTVRTIFVWAYFMMPFVEESFREEFLVLQLVGFLFLISGNIIYNEIIRIPFCGLDFYTKVKIDERGAKVPVTD